MTTQLEARIARVARARGCGFAEAARVVALAAAARRRALVVRRRLLAAERLTRARGMWWRKGDLE